MSEDALWLVDLFQMQLGSLRGELSDPRIRRDKFDKFSYSAWAITETMLSIDDYSGFVEASTIREILKMQFHDYTNYYINSRNKELSIKYKYAADMVEYLYTLTEGYVYDEYSTNLMGGHFDD